MNPSEFPRRKAWCFTPNLWRMVFHRECSDIYFRSICSMEFHLHLVHSIYFYFKVRGSEPTLNEVPGAVVPGALPSGIPTAARRVLGIGGHTAPSTKPPGDQGFQTPLAMLTMQNSSVDPWESTDKMPNKSWKSCKISENILEIYHGTLLN